MNLDALPDDATVTVRVGWLRTVLDRSGPEGEPPVRSVAPLTVAEVAEQMGRSESTVRGWLGSGELEGFRVGREWRVRPEAVADYYRRAEDAHQGGEGDPDPDDADLGGWRKVESRR